MAETICPSSSPSAHRMHAPTRFHVQVDSQPWTAARCHRLLRQLQCRLGTLRRLMQETRRSEMESIPKRTSSHHTRPTKPSKRARHTYAQRQPTTKKPKRPATPLTTPPRSTRTLGTMKIDQCSPVSGRIDFPTPVLRKICSQPDVSRRSPLREKLLCPATSSLITDLHMLRPRAPEGHYLIYESIFGWLSCLLRSTNAMKAVPHPKSLLGMCLRKVPAALADIESWDKKAAEEEGVKSPWESTNASVELYGQLEMFGSAGSGWKPLGFVVRAHALSILQTAVSERLFEPEFVRLIADLYLSFKCHQDAVAIIMSFPSQIPDPRSPLSMLHETRNMQPLAAIAKSLQGEGNSRVAFECLSNLVENGQLPLDWLYTKGFRDVWVAALEAISTSKPEPSAANFAYVAMERLLLKAKAGESLQQNAQKQALTSVVSGLAAIVLGRGSISSRQSGRPATRRLTHLFNQIVTCLQAQSKETSGDDLQIFAMVRYMAVEVSDHIDSGVRRQVEAECKQLLMGNHGSPSQVQYRNALFLVCSISQCRARVCGIASHDALSEICAMLVSLGLPDWFREGLRVDGAFVLAHKTKDLRDLAFAEKIPAANGGLTGAATIFSGWRWEEGISEWVHPSPKTKASGGDDEDAISPPNTSLQTPGSLGGRTGTRGLERRGGNRRNTSGMNNSLVSMNGDGESDCQDGDDSEDELSGEWDDSIGICGWGTGNGARAKIVHAAGGIGSRSDEAKLCCWQTQSGHGEGRISNNGVIRRVKRAGTRARGGRPRGVSHCGAEDGQGRDDDLDELM